MLKEKHDRLLSAYQNLGGATFDEHDVDQSAISYAYKPVQLKKSLVNVSKKT